MAIAEQQIWDKLRECRDPEIPCNIVDLGLIYGIRQEANRIIVKMTLTSPQCPMAGQIAGQVQKKLLEIPGVDESAVELVYDPPWSPANIAPSVRKQLGFH